MLIRWGLLVVTVGLAALVAGGLYAGSRTMFTFKIPVGAQVALLGRVVRVTGHHWGHGIGAPHAPAVYEYVFDDDPPPDRVEPLWDRGRWTHSYQGALRNLKGTKEMLQLRDFHRLVDYRTP